MNCAKCGAGNLRESRFCARCGTPLFKPRPSAAEGSADSLQYAKAEFDGGWKQRCREVLNWADLQSKELEYLVNTAKSAEQIVELQESIVNFLSTLDQIKREFSEMAYQAHLTYDQRPSLGNSQPPGAAPAGAQREELKALKILNQFSKQLETQRFRWEVNLIRMGGERG